MNNVGIMRYLVLVVALVGLLPSLLTAFFFFPMSASSRGRASPLVSQRKLSYRFRYQIACPKSWTGTVLYTYSRSTIQWHGRKLCRTLKRDYVPVSPLHDAQTVRQTFYGCIEDYNENHPHCGLRCKSLRDFRRAPI